MTDERFETLMNLTGGEVVRSVPGRSTVRLTYDGRVVYLKRYEPSYYPWYRRIFRHDEAEHEWNMLHALQRAGFNVPTPVAFGRRGARSFVMTEEIAGGVQADHLKTPPLAAIGKLARQFHDAGFIHKDFYLSHVFVAGEKLFFIDLQRVLGPGKFSRRWIVKDLAALAHSAARIGLPAEELLRAYGGDEALMRKVAARMAWMKNRKPKYVGVWDDPQKSKAQY
jgi:tRNA A-37 threonylcarbamoyl transferase component Bud32